MQPVMQFIGFFFKATCHAGSGSHYEAYDLSNEQVIRIGVVTLSRQPSSDDSINKSFVSEVLFQPRVQHRCHRLVSLTLAADASRRVPVVTTDDSRSPTVSSISCLVSCRSP